MERRLVIAFYHFLRINHNHQIIFKKGKQIKQFKLRQIKNMNSRKDKEQKKMEKNKVNRGGQKLKKEHVKTIRYVYESRKWREKKHDSVKKI